MRLTIHAKWPIYFRESIHKPLKEFSVEHSRDFRPFNLLRPFAWLALAIMAATSIALAFLINGYFHQNLLELSESKNAALATVMSNYVWQENKQHLLASAAARPAALQESRIVATIDDRIRDHTRDTRIVKVKIYTPDAFILFSTARDEIGQNKFGSQEIARAAQGELVTRFSHRDTFYARDELITDVNIVSSYLPIKNNAGSIEAVFEIYSDVSEQVADSRITLVKVVVGIIAIAAFTYVLLFWVVRYAQGIINRQQIEIHKQATHDHLTGLPNRALFMDRFSNAIKEARRTGHKVVLMYLDLDRFKIVNDTLGHHAGDAMLVEVARRLGKTMRDYDTVARIGGDEFTIVMRAVTEVREAQVFADRICQCLQSPVTTEGKDVPMRASIGISVFPDDGPGIEELISHADVAMYHAKQNSDVACYHFFEAATHEKIHGQKRRLQELHTALGRDEFELYFQPKVNATSGDIIGSEALLRWQHPEHGLVSPLEFIPLLEESGLIIQVGAWVLHEACRLNRSWQQMGLPAVPVAVNVSGVQFNHEDFIASVQESIQETELSPEFLEVEVTESCLMDDVDKNIAVLGKLREMGVSIAVDDFGTGYSSLSYLQRFPINTLKIDRSFVSNVHNRKDNDNAAIVTAIMALSHSLRLNVVAEGVENAQELAYLHALGCKSIQGFLFSRPLSAGEFEKLLADSVSMQKTMESVRKSLAQRRA